MFYGKALLFPHFFRHRLFDMVTTSNGENPKHGIINHSIVGLTVVMESWNSRKFNFKKGTICALTLLLAEIVSMKK